MLKTVIFIIFAYLSGSVLYANIFADLFGKRELYQNSPDQNPGAANAFQYGGFLCGTLTLLCDLLKGFLPVHLYLRFVPAPYNQGLFLVLAAPVIGHIFPLFSDFRGGKGIAVTFGCLLGLFPYLQPVYWFAAVFVFLSAGIRITPHFYRTIAAYLITAAALMISGAEGTVCAGFLIITGMVCLKMHLSKEEREKFEVKLLWMR